VDPLDISQKIINGKALQEHEAMSILSSSGSEMAYFFAGAQKIRETFLGKNISLCSIINAKSGRCSENCSFCSQSSHYQTDAPIYPLRSCQEIVADAKKAEESGSCCFGIVTSGTKPAAGEEFNEVLQAIREIRQTTNISPSASLGILDSETAKQLADAGCATYHHNLETARSFFPNICTTHDYELDVETVKVAKKVGMKVCCGGIFGLGESLEQRLELALTLRDLDVDSVPLNFLNPVPGTPLENRNDLSPMDCLRTIAMFRHILPDRKISVCGGRETNLREFQSWIFMAGASGMMIGNYLTTTGRNVDTDLQLIRDAEVTAHVCS